MRVRENLTKLEEDRINNEYFREVLDSMVEQAEVLYPEPMVGEQVETILKRLDQDLRQRGLTLDDYKRLYNKTDEDLYQEYRDVAVQTLKRSLVMRTLVESEDLQVGPEDIEQEVDRIVARFGERSDEFRKLFRESSMRQSVVNDLMNQRVIERVMAIAKGEAPELAAATEEPAAAETEEE
jgi:trigger factor